MTKEIKPQKIDFSFRAPPGIEEAENKNVRKHRVIDEKTSELISVDLLYEKINRSMTPFGGLKLRESLLDPLTSQKQIKAKQEGVQELTSNDHLRDSVENYLGTLQVGLEEMYDYLATAKSIYKHDLSYEDFDKILQAGIMTKQALDNIPAPESRYIRSIISTLKQFGDTDVYRLFRGPLYRTRHGFKSKEDIKLLTPRKKYTPGMLTPGGILPTTVFLAATVSATFIKDPELQQQLLKTIPLGMFPIMVSMAMTTGKPHLDNRFFINPFRDKLLSDEGFLQTIGALGSLDELMSFSHFYRESPFPTVIPKIVNSETHQFSARGLTNPVLAKNNPGFVPNDVNLDTARLTAITGPNSGGKTTYCLSVVQNQLLAQIGSPIAASDATISVADRIFYQAPSFNKLTDDEEIDNKDGESEGRFGTELKRTRHIFKATLPKSLVVLDELAEGTTYEEKMTMSKAILDGFKTIGNTTLMVTHNHQLVEDLQSEEDVQCLQVGFQDEKPTFKLVKGISYDSHALRVAKKLDFDPESIKTNLKKRGYINE